jgi:5'(3')-deoxyribonucleotidase
MGNDDNLKYKGEWIEENLPCVTEYIPVNFSDYENKAHIDMTGQIFIDDCAHNLETSNAEIKILYGDIFDWNKDYKGKRCWNWTEVYDYLNN